MSPGELGVLLFALLLVLVLIGMPIAFALGGASLAFMLMFMPAVNIHGLAETLYHGLENFTLLAIPLFILMGVAIGSTRASSDIYESAYRWLYRVPGGLAIANVFGCTMFAAMCGSSTATSAAVGAMGVPEMRKRGYSPGFAGGLIAAGGTLGILIPPSVTFILYGIVVEQSIGKLFIAGIVPGLILAILFALWVFYKALRDGQRARAGASGQGAIERTEFTWRQRLESLPRLTPFLLIIAVVMIALYGGFATPSEVAGVGALTTVVLVILIYRCYRWPELRSILLGTLKESCMIMMIIAMAVLFSYVMSYLYISQSATEWLIELELSSWSYLFWIDVLIVVLGLFLPPPAIIVMVTPMIMPGLLAHGFDPIWFGVNMTLLLEVGLLTPPVGLNLFVIKGIAPDISLAALVRGVMPFITIIMLFVVVVSIFPQIALWLPALFFQN